MLLHLQRRDEELAARDGAPAHGPRGEDVPDQTREREEDRDPGEGDYGEEAVAQHGDYTGETHSRH